MASQDQEQEAWDLVDLPEEMFSDFTEEFLSQPPTLDDHAQQLQQLQEEMLHDFSSFEQEFLVQPTIFNDQHAQQQQQQQQLLAQTTNTFDDHNGQQQHDELELTLDEIIGMLNDEPNEQPKPPPIPLPPPPPPPRVNQPAKGTPKTSSSSNPKRRGRGRARLANTPEEIERRALAMERRKIKNREFAANMHAKKQKYVKDLETLKEDLSKENAIYKRNVKYLEIRLKAEVLPRKLARTTSEPIPKSLPNII